MEAEETWILVHWTPPVCFPVGLVAVARTTIPRLLTVVAGRSCRLRQVCGPGGVSEGAPPIGKCRRCSAAVPSPDGDHFHRSPSMPVSFVAGRCSPVTDRPLHPVPVPHVQDQWHSTSMGMHMDMRSFHEVNSRSLLLPYALGLIVAMVVIQAVVALTGGTITVLVGALTALVPLGIAIWLVLHRQELRHVRFGTVVAHTIAFVTVTTLFNLHAFLRVAVLGAQQGGLDGIPVQTWSTWFGPTLAMSALWGPGLLIHLVGSVLGRGWED